MILKKIMNTVVQIYILLVEKGQEAVNGILELAQESDSARAYEVAATTIKAVADTTDKLIDLQQKMKDLEQDPNKRLYKCYKRIICRFNSGVIKINQESK